MWAKGVSASYGELIARAARAGEDLARSGVREGDVVALGVEFGVDAAARWLALLRARAVAALVPCLCPLDDPRVTGACAAWHWGPGVDLRRLDAPADHALLFGLRRSGKPGLVLFTGGTTARPKAVLHDADEFLAARESSTTRDYRLLSIMPMQHVGGLDTLVRLWWSGATLVVPQARAPLAVAEAIVDGGVEVLVTPPSFLNLFCLAGPICIEAGAILRVVAFGAEPMPPSLLTRMNARWPRTQFRQRFGATEVGPISVGGGDGTDFAIDPAQAEHRIVDGELWVRARGQMLGYLNAPESGLTPDGWFATGDQVVQLPGGFLRVRGRCNTVVNVGGVKVLPEEIERALAGVDGVAAIRAYGQPHAIMGQTMTIEVVAGPGIDRAELRIRLRAEAARVLESHQRPVAIRFVENLKLTESEKIARQ